MKGKKTPIGLSGIHTKYNRQDGSQAQLLRCDNQHNLKHSNGKTNQKNFELQSLLIGPSTLWANIHNMAVFSLFTSSGLVV